MKKLISVVILLALCVAAFAACKPGETKKDALTLAKEYIYTMYRNEAEVTASDYTRVGVVSIDGVTYTVEWTANITSGPADGVKTVKSEDGSTVTVDIDEKASADVVYTLKATIKDAEGKTAELSFDHKVPAFKEFTWAEYVAAAKDDTVIVKGVITAIMAKSKGNSYNCLYLQDNDGGYYAYNMATDPVTDDKLEVGMTVRVTGTRDTYNGTYEIMKATVEIVDSNKTPATAVDFTERYQKATSLKDEALTAQQGMLVTLKGVEITGEDTSGGYYKFKLGEYESYIRISSSVCPITKDEQETLKKGHAEHTGWTANVTGIICVYDGAFYLTPASADAFEYVGLPQKDDAGMVAFEKDGLSVVSTVTADTEIELPSVGKTYDKVAITWESDNAAAVVANGKLTIKLPDTDATVKLTATLKCGSVTETRVFEIKLVATEMSYAEIVDAAYKLEAGASLPGTCRLFGKIIKIDTAWSNQFKNITVTIEVAGLTDKPIMCFRLTGDGAESLAVGDEITVEGAIKNYNGTIEFDSGCRFIGKGEHIDQSKTVGAAYSLAEGESMSSPVILKGVISKIDTAWSDQYKNITVTIIVDGITDKPIMCFRLKGEGADKLAEGQTINVYGTIKNYQGTVEFDAGCLLIADDDVAAVKTVISAYKLAQDTALDGEKTLTGVITKIDTPYSEQYQNITVTITVAGISDKTIQCFRMVGEGAANLAEGQVITVTGTLKNFKGTVEFDAKCTFKLG